MERTYKFDPTPPHPAVPDFVQVFYTARAEIAIKRRVQLNLIVYTHAHYCVAELRACSKLACTAAFHAVKQLQGSYLKCNCVCIQESGGHLLLIHVMILYLQPGQTGHASAHVGLLHQLKKAFGFVSSLPLIRYIFPVLLRGQFNGFRSNSAV